MSLYYKLLWILKFLKYMCYRCGMIKIVDFFKHNRLNDSIKLNYELENNNIMQFLDSMVNREEDQLLLSICRKSIIQIFIFIIIIFTTLVQIICYIFNVSEAHRIYHPSFSGAEVRKIITMHISNSY